jgi:heptaprenyl diphosphate synthase
MENEEIRKEIEKVHEEMDPSDIAKIISLIKQSDAIEKSFALSDLYLQKALMELEGLPSNRVKKTLQDIAKYIGRRKF